MAKESNRTNGDYFEKAVVIWHNLYRCGVVTDYAAGGDLFLVEEEDDRPIDEIFTSYLRIAKHISENTFHQPVDVAEPIVKALAKGLEADVAALAPKYDLEGTEVWYQIGQNTMTGIGDIDISGGNSDSEPVTVEVKFVGAGSGTYHQTSARYFSKILGLEPYTGDESYCSRLGYYENLQEIFDYYQIPYPVSTRTVSPIPRKKASAIVAEFPDAYEDILSLEAEYRVGYVSEIAQAFHDDPALFARFFTDMLNKRKLTGGGHATYTADILAIANWNQQTCQAYDLYEVVEDMTSTLMEEIVYESYTDASEDADDTNYDAIYDSATEIDDQGYSFTAAGMRAVLSWKNRCGLNNPAIFVFIDV